MGNFWVYSTEPMPRTDLFSKRDHNPAAEYIAFNSVYIDPVPAKTWVKLPDKIKSLRHHDRTDRQGHVYHVFDDEIVKANRERLGPRGVIFIDHEPTAAEKAELEKQSLNSNLEFRLNTIQQYEESRHEAETNGRSLKANTYVKECYTLLGMEMPGSIEAIKSQRQPGEAAAERFAAALEKLVAHLTPQPKPDAGGKAKVI